MTKQTRSKDNISSSAYGILESAFFSTSKNYRYLIKIMRLYLFDLFWSFGNTLTSNNISFVARVHIFNWPIINDPVFLNLRKCQELLFDWSIYLPSCIWLDCQAVCVLIDVSVLPKKNCKQNKKASNFDKIAFTSLLSCWKVHLFDLTLNRHHLSKWSIIIISHPLFGNYRILIFCSKSTIGWFYRNCSEVDDPLRRMKNNSLTTRHYWVPRMWSIWYSLRMKDKLLLYY